MTWLGLSGTHPSLDCGEIVGQLPEGMAPSYYFFDSVTKPEPPLLDSCVGTGRACTHSDY